MKSKKFCNLFLIAVSVVFSIPALGQVSSRSQDILAVTMSADITGKSTTKLNVDGKNMYKWFDYPESYGHVLSEVEQNELNHRTDEGKERELILNTISKANTSAFCTSFGKITSSMKDGFKDLKGRFINELVYKVSECNEKLPGASKATLQEAEFGIKCEQIFLKTQDYNEALLAFEKIKKELAPCHPKDWFVTEDFPGIKRGDKDKYFGFYNSRYKADPGRMDIGLEMVLNFDTYFVRMVFKKSN
ncbi:MAG: hypothetical protein POELPBGB_03052 [Bacteroidia bacterium]|nr:hypothetical protein [Bacteroidia bacterium]